MFVCCWKDVNDRLLSVFAGSSALQTRQMRRLEMSDAFAIALRRHRMAMGLSQELLAEKAGLHPTYIGLVERGLRNPSLNASKSLASALGLSLSKLIDEAEAVQQKRK
jgi:ribosome-binding protein aMBF1 (putative translation factor)